MRFFFLLLVTFLASVAHAGDGDPCEVGSTYPGGQCMQLCDSHTGIGTCGPVKLSRAVGPTAIELQNTTCTAGTVKVFSRSETTLAAKPWHHIGTLDLSADATDTTKVSLILINEGFRPMAYIKGIVESTQCDNEEFTVVIHQR